MSYKKSSISYNSSKTHAWTILIKVAQQMCFENVAIDVYCFNGHVGQVFQFVGKSIERIKVN